VYLEGSVVGGCPVSKGEEATITRGGAPGDVSTGDSRFRYRNTVVLRTPKAGAKNLMLAAAGAAFHPDPILYRQGPLRGGPFILRNTAGNFGRR
jgi:hypothetical protein